MTYSSNTGHRYTLNQEGLRQYTPSEIIQVQGQVQFSKRVSYFLNSSKFSSPLAKEVYGHHEHAALMEAHKKREKYGEYNEFARRCGTLTKKVVRGLTQSEEEHTYSSVPEPPKPK